MDGQPSAQTGSSLLFSSLCSTCDYVFVCLLAIATNNDKNLPN